MRKHGAWGTPAGFWEQNGYHMYGDPFREQRHGGGVEASGAKAPFADCCNVAAKAATHKADLCCPSRAG
jgi:hypothetical protein